MFKGVVDSLVVYLVGKFGYPDEALQQDAEIMKLKKALVEEKLKASTNMQEELGELRAKVEELNSEKVFMLEQEITRLRHENSHLKQLPPPPTPQGREPQTIDRITAPSRYQGEEVVTLKNFAMEVGVEGAEHWDEDKGEWVK